MRLPAYDAPVANINSLIQPLQQGFADYRQASDAAYGEKQRLEQQGYARQRNALTDTRYEQERIERAKQRENENRRADAQLSIQQQSAGIQQQRYTDEQRQTRLSQLGNLARMAANEQDPARQQLYLDTIRAKDPELFEKVIPQNASPADQLRLIQGLGGAQQSAPEHKLMEVNGRIVRVGPTGPAEEVYSAPQGHGGNFKDPKQQYDVESGLRKEYSGLNKGFQDVTSAYSRVQTAFKNPSAAGDMAGIFGFMKMLDPGSVVREGEFANAQNAAGVPQRIINLYNQILRGERLSPEQRADFSAQSEAIYAAERAKAENLRKQFEPIVRGSGLDPSRVLLDHGMPLDVEQIRREAQEAIQNGADPEKVRQRLEQAGIR